MTPFGPDIHFPRASAPESARSLVSIHGKRLDDIRDRSINLKVAEFHPSGKERVSEQELLSWREALNVWAADEGFPSQMDPSRRSEWDVLLGQHTIEDLKDSPGSFTQTSALDCDVPTPALCGLPMGLATSQ